MTSHTYHEDSHTHGLADDCPRCYEHSLHPFESLDESNIRNLALRVEQNLDARSENERTAMNVIDMVLFRARRLKAMGIEI
jgi:hypothetical protein